jgi:peroxiredoxin
MKLSRKRDSNQVVGGPLPVPVLILALAVLLAAVTPVLADGDGKKTADFSLKSTEGETYRLSDLTGKKVVVITFWNIDCKPCRKEMPKLQEIYDELKDRGLEILAINTDGPSDIPGVKPLVRRKGYTYPVLLDSQQQVVKLYNPRSILPYLALIDLEGKVVYTHLGYNSGDEVELQNKILELLPGGSDGTPADTTSVEGEDDRG